MARAAVRRFTAPRVHGERRSRLGSRSQQQQQQHEEDVSVILNAAKQAESYDFAFREQSGNCGMGPEEKKTEWW